jgi:hypothetical protein
MLNLKLFPVSGTGISAIKSSDLRYWLFLEFTYG